jgi:predicted nucleotidyltransferase
MRLNTEQIQTIKKEAAHFFGAQAEVWLFGSRVDDAAKGGDIDLYVRATSGDADELANSRFAFLARLKRRMGDRKIDLVLQREGGEVLPIYQLARQQGVQL